MKAGVVRKCLLVIFWFVGLSIKLLATTIGGNSNDPPVISGLNINSCIGEITITVTSGKAPYSYKWEDTDGNVLPSTSFIISDLMPGNYKVTVTDTNGEIATDTFPVNAPPDLMGDIKVLDVKCRGDASGGVEITMTNGKPAYSWTLKKLVDDGGSYPRSGSRDGLVIRILNSLSSGDYLLELEDEQGCEGSVNFTIAEPAEELGLDLIEKIEPLCFGDSTGSITVQATGGTITTIGYTYSWFNSTDGDSLIEDEEEPTLSGLLAGSYKARIRDENGCVYIEEFLLMDPQELIVSDTLVVNASCNGLADGAIDITAEGGTGDLSYGWSNGAMTEDISGLTAGNYTVTITDENSCSLVESYVVGQPSAINITESITQVRCKGESTGSITTSVSGGGGGYSYLWSDGSRGSSISNLEAGNYSLTVMDDTGCSVTENYEITEPATGLEIDSFTDASPVCAGGSDGSLEVNPSGGVAPFTYRWSNGATTKQITGLSAGPYSVTVTDSNDCTATDDFSLNDPTPIAVAATPISPTCHGDLDGSISVSASNGTAPYTYSWNTGSTDPMISGLVAGSYTVTITDDIGCGVVQNFDLTQPDVLQVNGAFTNVSCNGLDDGSISTAVSGGTMPYTYVWSNGENTETISSLEPAMYSVTVTDANGCVALGDYTIIEPDELVASASATDILCKGDNTGAVNLTVSGGTGPYTYQWSNGESTEDLSMLLAGSYMVTVTDANGCQAMASDTVNEPAELLVITGLVEQTTCNGDTDGSIALTITGGEEPYTISWTDGGSSLFRGNLGPGLYTIEVTDNLGCFKTDTYEITDPPALSLAGVETPVSCNGANDGAINLTVTGGEGPYTFDWAHDPDTEDVSGLGPGAYAVTVTDSRGCFTNASFMITEPVLLTASSTQTEVNCKGAADGTVDVTVAGGTLPYAYSWSNGSTTEDLNGVVADTYTLTITDGRGCLVTETVTLTEPADGLTITPTITNVLCSGGSTGSIELSVGGGTGPYTYAWNTGPTTRDLFDVLPGSYEVTVTDSQGCTRLEIYEVVAPDALSVLEVISDLSCFEAGDGAINITISGGTAPYTYLWADGEVTEDLNNLAAGSYSVTITDAGNCSTTGNFTVNQPTEIIINPLTRGVSCFGETDGLIDISVSGGIGPYTYAWSNGSMSQDLMGLAGGTYTVTVTDNTNCPVSADITVVAPTAALNATGAITDIGCNGEQSGGVELNVTGGTAPYRFVWSNGSTLQNLQNAFPGTYDVMITDDNDCAFEATFEIGEAEPIEATFDPTEPTCPNDANGSILLEVTGGAGPFTYFWSNGSTSKDQFNLLGGPYTVTIRDANNCTVTRSIDLGGTRGLEITPNFTPVSCKGGADGAVSVDVFGGSGNYSYSWSNGITTRDQTGLTAGLYVLTVTDEDGCDSSITVVISEPSQVLSATVAATDKLICFGDTNGTASVNANGGTAPYNYLWSTGEISGTITNLTAGNYNVLVTDANGCTSQTSFVVRQPDAAITVVASGKLRLDCFGDADGSITAAISGGEGPYELFWNNGRRTSTIDNLATGDYILRVVDIRGCVHEETITITAPSALAVAEVTINDTQCFGDRTGSVELDIEGGTAPYTYLWSNGSTSQNLIGVGTGDYTVEVTDDQGCTLLATFSLDNAPFFGLVPEVAEISCTDENDASISLNIVGGVAPYTIGWNSGQDDETITSLAEGTYTAVVTDSNGCMLEQTFLISNPLPLSIEGVVASADACDNPDSGSINLIVTGGRGPYEYSWLHGPDTPFLSGTPPGIYTVTVTDASGCTKTEAFTVTQPKPISIDLTPEIIVDCDAQSVFVRLGARVEGGFGDYQYNWSRGNSLDASLEVNDPGRVTLVITDGRGCQRQAEIDIEIPQFANADFIISSEGLNRDNMLSANDLISFTDNSGPGAVSWSWSFGDEFSSTEQNPEHTYASLGDYAVRLEVTDGVGCITESIRNLRVEEGFRVMIPSAFTPNGNGENDLFRPKFFGLREMTFLIYNRWGELIFSTSDLETNGWDGTINGKQASNDNYTYRFIGRSFNNILVNKAGGFKLLR